MNLAQYVRYVKDFPKTGVTFCDLTPLYANALAFDECINEMADNWVNEDIDRIGVFDARGFIFGSSLALLLGKPFFPIRKAGKLPHHAIRETYYSEYGTGEIEVHVDALNRDENILLVDDLLATGGTVETGIRLVNQLGGFVVGCQFAVEIVALPGRRRLAHMNVPIIAAVLSV